MSSGQKAVWEDENDWIEFKHSTDILNKVTWDVYIPKRLLEVNNLLKIFIK
jgi:hypothetical protein